MSRWRETLCGSVIKVLNRDLEHPSCVMKKATENLSCGGTFLPHKKHASPPKQENRIEILTLPKESYEVLVVGPQPGDPIRYCKTHDALADELERIETAYHRLLQHNH